MPIGSCEPSNARRRNRHQAAEAEIVDLTGNSDEDTEDGALEPNANIRIFDQVHISPSGEITLYPTQPSQSLRPKPAASGRKEKNDDQAAAAAAAAAATKRDGQAGKGGKAAAAGGRGRTGGKPKKEKEEKRVDAAGHTVKYAAKPSLKVRMHGGWAESRGAGLPSVPHHSGLQVSLAKGVEQAREEWRSSPPHAHEPTPTHPPQVKERIDRALPGSSHRMFLIHRTVLSTVEAEGGASESFDVLGATGNVCVAPLLQPSSLSPDLCIACFFFRLDKAGGLRPGFSLRSGGMPVVCFEVPLLLSPPAGTR
jgi:hypothetical protein